MDEWEQRFTFGDQAPHEHVFERYELTEPAWRFGPSYLQPRMYYVGYECECGEQGYAVPA